jgi:hypothetical protein
MCSPLEKEINITLLAFMFISDGSVTEKSKNIKSSIQSPFTNASIHPKGSLGMILQNLTDPTRAYWDSALIKNFISSKKTI